jgi:hypothetical protein
MALLTLMSTAVVAFWLTQIAAAEPIRYPEQGVPAFVIDLPSGWRATVYKDEGLQVEQDMFVRRQILILSILDRPEEVRDRSLADIATGVITGSMYPSFTLREPGSIAGHKGEVFFSSVEHPVGRVDLILTLVRLDPQHVAAMTTIADKSSPEWERAALQAIIGSIKIIVSK